MVMKYWKLDGQILRKHRQEKHQYQRQHQDHRIPLAEQQMRAVKRQPKVTNKKFALSKNLQISFMLYMPVRGLDRGRTGKNPTARRRRTYGSQSGNSRGSRASHCSGIDANATGGRLPRLKQNEKRDRYGGSAVVDAQPCLFSIINLRYKF